METIGWTFRARRPRSSRCRLRRQPWRRLGGSGQSKRSLRWVDPTDENWVPSWRLISFEFGVPLKDAQIRVVKGGTTNKTNNATRAPKCCSLVGRQALTNSLDDTGNATTRKAGQASMFITNIELVEHEFGHALCLLHEQSYDTLPIKIDQQKAIDYYRQPPNKWKAEVTIANVLTPAKRPQRCLGDKVFNPASVMLYSIPREITEDGTSLYAGTTFTHGTGNASTQSTVPDSLHPALPSLGGIDRFSATGRRRDRRHQVPGVMGKLVIL